MNVLHDQHQTGLLAPFRSVAPIVHERVRATVPVVEALRAAGATVVGAAETGYRITLGAAMPAGIVAVLGQDFAAADDGLFHPCVCLRLAYEPAYPAEHVDLWLQAEWLPCPVCGAPVIWYEAGYVPGWRVCTRRPYHHSRVGSCD